MTRHFLVAFQSRNSSTLVSQNPNSSTLKAGQRSPFSSLDCCHCVFQSHQSFVGALAFQRRFSTSTAITIGEVETLETLERWSKGRLSETTQPDQMKLIIGDVASRLGRQWMLLDKLYQLTICLQQHPNNTKHAVPASMIHDWWSGKDDRRRLRVEQALETIKKNIHSTKVLHRDTQTTCLQFHESLPESNLSPLLQRQLGQACKEIYARHALTIETLAEIVIDLRGILVDDEAKELPTTMKEVQSIVTTFLQSRLMTQLLCDHVVDCMLNKERKPNGAISVNVNVQDLVQSAVLEARHLVEGNFVTVAEEPLDQAEEPPEPPHVVVQTSPELTATLVRPWLQYALVELFKNSLAVTMERNRRDDDHSPFWPMYVEISETPDNVILQLLDQGGGLQGPSKKDWFEFANRRDKWDRLDDQQTYATVSSPIRGFGVGLALSRLHLRQFGGDLILYDRQDPLMLEMNGKTDLLQAGLTATLILSKNFDSLETSLQVESGDN